MTKRILSLLLAAMMVLGSIIVVSAAEDEIDYDVENAFAIDVLKDINVLQGYDEDDFALDAAIKRYEMSLFIARALTGKTKDTYWEGAKNETPFTDLDGFKYAGSTTWTYNHGIILGKDNKTFDPNGYITYQEAIAMVLRAWADYYVEGGLKTLNINDAVHYPWRHIELADYLGLTVDVDPETKYTDVLSRGAVAQLVYNLLTFDPMAEEFADLDDGVEKFWAETDPASEKVFGLFVSSSEGVLVAIDDEEANAADHETMPNWLKNTIWAWQTVAGSETKVFKPVASETLYDIAALTPDHFAEFDLEVEEDVYYNIVYYTRREVKTNPVTGAVTLGNKVETVIVSIEKVSVDDLVYTNSVAAQEYTLQTEAAKTSDNKDGKALVSITAGDVVYPVIGEDALTVRLMKAIGDYKVFDAATFGSYNKEEALVGKKADDINAIVKELTPVYADLRVEDTDGDGEVDTLTIVPYVFAEVYTEVETDATDDGKKTTYKFVNYAVVLLDDATAVANKAFTWTKAALDKDGKDVDYTGSSNAAYVVDDSVKTIAEATTVVGTLSGYDVRDGKTNYITIEGEKYGYKYDALKGWSKDAAYYALAAQSELFDIYDNKDIEDDELPAGEIKYLKVWLIDNNIVALEGVDAEGEVVEQPEEEEKTVYTGVIDLIYPGAENRPSITYTSGATIDLSDDNIKLISGKYYIVLDAYVDGVYTKSLPVYLADETVFNFVSGNYTSQYNAWLANENTKINAALDKIDTAVALNDGLIFYTVDSLNNVIVATNTTHVVNGANYVEFIGGEKYAKPAYKDNAYTETASAIKYTMDTRADDYIEFTITPKNGTAATTDYKGDIATSNTHWLFIDKDGNTQVAFGIPEYDSSFTTIVDEDGFAMIKNKDVIVVFLDDDTNGDPILSGFKYAMHDDALYALVDNTTKLLDKGIRDGYLYFSVKDLFKGTPMEIIVEEDTVLAETLKGYVADWEATPQVAHYNIVAVTKTEHELLQIYGTEAAAVNAIAQLTGDNALVLDGAHNIASKEDLEAAIQKQFNLTKVETLLMGVDKDKSNIIYSVDTTTKKVTQNNGMPLVTTTADYYVFFTPASGDKEASYVVFIYDSAIGAATSATAFENAIADGTPTIALNANVDSDAVITLAEDTVINLNGYNLDTAGIITNGHNLTINALKVVNGTNVTYVGEISVEGALADVSEPGGVNANAAIYATNGATVELNGVTVKGWSTGVYVKNATLKVNAGSVITGIGTTDTSNNPDAIRAYGESTVVIAEGAKLAGNEERGSALELYDKATATVAKGATLTGLYGIAVFGGSVETSGNITAGESAICISNWDPNANASVVVKDGTIKGTKWAIELCKANRKADTTATPAVTAVVVKVELAGGVLDGAVEDTKRATTTAADGTLVEIQITGKVTMKNFDGTKATFKVPTGATGTIVDAENVQKYPATNP